MTSQNPPAQPREADRPRDIGAKGWWSIAKQTWAESGEDDLSLVASGIAFNAFLALVPLLTAVVLGYGLVASPQDVANHIAALARTLPQDATQLIANQLKNMVQSAGASTGFGIVITLAIAIYGATRGATGVITGLNIMYDIEESRSFLGQMGVALVITLGMILLFVVASVAITLVSIAEQLLPELGGFMRQILQIVLWLAAAAAVNAVIAMIYAYAPNREQPQWQWLTPGSVIATLVWIAATLAFSFYVRNFGSYNATYGALGAVIVFLTWLYLSSYILLLGAELNQVLERRARDDDAQRPAKDEPPLPPGVHKREEVVKEARESGQLERG